jgi:hypothetical protein
MGNRQNLSPARNQKTTTELTAIFQLSRSQSEDFTEKKLRGPGGMNYVKINVILFCIILPVVLLASLALNLAFILGWL